MAQTEVEQYKTYEYDSFNKTAQTVVEKYKEGGKETHIQRNYYDAENLRYGIEEDGERTNLVTNGWSVFTELDAEWKTTKRLVRGYGIIASEECGHEVEESITTEPTVFNRYHFFHQNEHGDTEYITGSNGEVTNAYTYDAFGTITNSSELVKNRYTYNGEQYDQISQQYYLRARNYNPLIGRFTQEDVYRGDGLNLYAYCGNNPVMYVDPSGYEYIPSLFDENGTVPGTSSSTNLGENIFEHLGINKGTKGTGSHQKQHLIPQDVYNDSDFLQSLGFQVDHHQNGIFDVNKNNTSTSLNKIFQDNNVSENLTQRYISENTHHSGYHELYNEAVAKSVADIEQNIAFYEKYLRKQGYSASEITKMTRKEGRKQVHSLLEDLRVMNQDGMICIIIIHLIHNHIIIQMNIWICLKRNVSKRMKKTIKNVEVNND